MEHILQNSCSLLALSCLSLHAQPSTIVYFFIWFSLIFSICSFSTLIASSYLFPLNWKKEKKKKKEGRKGGRKAGNKSYFFFLIGLAESSCYWILTWPLVLFAILYIFFLTTLWFWTFAVFSNLHVHYTVCLFLLHTSEIFETIYKVNFFISFILGFQYIYSSFSCYLKGKASFIPFLKFSKSKIELYFRIQMSLYLFWPHPSPKGLINTCSFFSAQPSCHFCYRLFTCSSPLAFLVKEAVIWFVLCYLPIT